VTGDALWSLHGTHDLAGQLKRPTGIENVPKLMPRRLGEIVRLPEGVAGAIGFAAALVWFRRRALVPAAVLALNAVAYVVLAVAGLPLLGRYLFLAAAMVSLFAGVAVFGWTGLDRDQGTLRGAWRLAGLVVLAAVLVFMPDQVDRLRTLRSDIRAREQVQSDLERLVRRPAARAALARCEPLFVPNHRPVPELAYWTGRRPADVVSAQLVRPSRDGLFVAPATARSERLSVLDPRDRSAPAAPPPGYRPLVRNRSWVMYGGGCA
jgi:hypothetical protein